jgi:hypothetical protein
MELVKKIEVARTETHDPSFTGGIIVMRIGFTVDLLDNYRS